MLRGVIPIAGAKTARRGRDAGALGWRLTDEEVAQLEQVSVKKMRQGEIGR